MKFPKIKPARDMAYRDFVRQHECTDCRWPYNPTFNLIEAHHIKTGGMATKCSDYLIIPLCNFWARGCHASADKRKETPKKYLKKVEELQAEWVSKGGVFKDEKSRD